MQPLHSMKGESVKKVLYALSLTTALTLAGFPAAGAESPQQQSDTSGWEYRSTCRVTCFSLETGATDYTIFNVTQDECCGGTAWSCPPDAQASHPVWGEPGKTCPVNEW
jgi:hypothetical protein